MGGGPDALENITVGNWLQWYPRAGGLKDGVKHVEMLGRNLSWEPTMWAFNASAVQPALPPVSTWPEAAKVFTGYAFGGPSESLRQSPNAEEARAAPQRLFGTTPTYYRLAPFNGNFGTSIRLATNCLHNCDTTEEVSDVPKFLDYAITNVGNNNSDLTAVHLLESHRYLGVVKIRHREQTLDTSTL